MDAAAGPDGCCRWCRSCARVTAALPTPRKAGRSQCKSPAGKVKAARDIEGLKMDEDEIVPEEDHPDVGAIGIDQNHPNSIRYGFRKTCSDADNGDDAAMIRQLEFVRRVISGIDIEKETSIGRLALASLKKPVEYLLNDKKAMLAAFGVFREAKRPIEQRTYERHISMAQEMGKQLAKYATETRLERKRAEAKAKKEVGERLGAHVNTVGAAYKKYHYIAKVVEFLEKDCISRNRE
ncbi:hypothetical protein [Nitrosovibrio sp. Nv17]|uniref:hypothetical protein n=1 Tax=Nitrosovibrio sp. Nv17 TaxID=1855339 RepID=UPI00116013A2|nr:hypothetical protein [Nitrosovibrio sp. Nv17]